MREHAWLRFVLFNQGPKLEDLTPEALERLRETNIAPYLKSKLPLLSRALASLGCIVHPLPLRSKKGSALAITTHRQMSLKGGSPGVNASMRLQPCHRGRALASTLNCSKWGDGWLRNTRKGSSQRTGPVNEQ